MSLALGSRHFHGTGGFGESWAEEFLGVSAGWKLGSVAAVPVALGSRPASSSGTCRICLRLLKGGSGLTPLLLSPSVVATGTSLALSSLLSLLLFAGMQMYSRQLASTEWLTIQGGLLGSGLFVFSLTVSSLRCRGEGHASLCSSHCPHSSAPIAHLTP